MHNLAVELLRHMDDATQLVCNVQVQVQGPVRPVGGTVVLPSLAAHSVGCGMPHSSLINPSLARAAVRPDQDRN
ncbi:hypothetical protein CPLU01_14837 [Colletotrichum plurivorum]|uniref:Uncharacterized protein n=1 Tax=Colletotrichum plurivorum TaxID=2175906 RepID=A0A8H6MXJ4_9PEZI|nr:hypothetical protein CPLU01_14837 [Colletotrichum plurivorum]